MKHKKQDQDDHNVKADSGEERALQEASEQTVSVTEDVEPDRLAEHISALQEELDQLRKDVEESQNHYLRVLADFDNFRKRQREETARQVGLAREELLLKFLPLVDNLERTLEAAEAQHSYESLVEGVSLTLRQVKEMLQKEGVEPIDAVGQEFNPELHEAMMRVETDEYPENTVIDEFEKGYTLNGKVIRPARVRVATGS
ncbi:MAG: nucleotide exchange factor GrpE [Armatimonadetes bacterium]|nr:nucleotide exchange factor GrpE [Armatimonadota bacterium]